MTEPAKVEWQTSAALVEYPDALLQQEERNAAIRKGEKPELIWLLEHPPLYTAGTSSDPQEL
ncbi:MAG: lipoate-protein ligase B, partial [Pseudomonadota bacterium]